MFAAERLRAEGFDKVGLLFTVDEELSSKGRTTREQSPARTRVSLSHKWGTDRQQTGNRHQRLNAISVDD